MQKNPNNVSLIQKAKNVYASEGLSSLLDEVWRFMFEQVDSKVAKRYQRKTAQLYWLPYLYSLSSTSWGYSLTKINGNDECSWIAEMRIGR